MNDMVARLKLPDVLALFERYRVRMAFLFGSQAHGTARPESDVDLAVQMPSHRSRIERLEHATALEADLRRLLDLPVQVVVLDDANIVLRFESVVRGVPVMVPGVDEEFALEKKIRMQFEDLQHTQRFHLKAFRKRMGLEP